MKILSVENKVTFENLQKPTMSLIASFYEMSDEVKEIFADMLAIYDAHPTEETSQKISDKIMGRESATDKKTWIKEQAAGIFPPVRLAAKKKYLDQKQPVPKGLPTSGMLLVGLDVVSRAQKDLLMEAQAAARLISHVDVLDPYQPKTNYQNADGTVENAFLDKPFATKMQRLEHLVNAVVNDILTQHDEKGHSVLNENDIIALTRQSCRQNSFLQKARNEGIKTLISVATQLEKTNPTASQKITDLAHSLIGDKEINNNRLSPEDYNSLKTQVKNRPIESLVEHRTKQILSMNAALFQRALLKNQPNR